MAPGDPYLEAQTYGADLSSHTGTYKHLPPLPNGKDEAFAEALAKARVDTATALDSLSDLPNGRLLTDKHGLNRVTFRA